MIIDQLTHFVSSVSLWFKNKKTNRKGAENAENSLYPVPFASSAPLWFDTFPASSYFTLAVNSCTAPSRTVRHSVCTAKPACSSRSMRGSGGAG